MAKINPQLLERLKSKLGLSPSAVYARIQKIANARLIDLNHAAVILAADHGLSIQQYVTAGDFAAISGRGNHPATESTTAPAAVSSPGSPRTKKAKTATPSKARDNSIFVVHGRDEHLRKSMFAFLRALSLNPMEWSKAVYNASTRDANPNVGDIIDKAMARVQAVVVLFSPDDLVSLKPQFLSAEEKSGGKKPQGQARPNVLFEAGLALGRHPGKTLLVQVGTMRDISDIAGKHIVKLTNDTAKRKDVALRLRKIGCRVDLEGDDWINEGEFKPTEEK